MKKHTKKQFMRLRIALIFESQKRNRYIKKHKIFREMGENVFFQPRIIPSDPELIKFHNNIVVGSNTTFVNHDYIHSVFNKIAGFALFLLPLSLTFVEMTYSRKSL